MVRFFYFSIWDLVVDGLLISKIFMLLKSKIEVFKKVRKGREGDEEGWGGEWGEKMEGRGVGG